MQIALLSVVTSRLRLNKYYNLASVGDSIAVDFFIRISFSPEIWFRTESALKLVWWTWTRPMLTVASHYISEQRPHWILKLSKRECESFESELWLDNRQWLSRTVFTSEETFSDIWNCCFCSEFIERDCEGQDNLKSILSLSQKWAVRFADESFNVLYEIMAGFDINLKLGFFKIV